MASFRVCFVGDSVTLGTGDAACLGWPNRLCAAEIEARGHDLSCYNLGVRAETSALIAARWEAECRPRLPDHVDGRLVFSFGLNDMADQEGVGQRTPTDRSVETARSLLSRAKSWKPTLWIGPTPVRREPPVIRPGQDVVYRFYRDRVKDASARYAALAETLEIPYLDLYSALADDPEWDRVMETGDGVHPTGDGYAKIADLVSRWEAWRAWLG